MFACFQDGESDNESDNDELSTVTITAITFACALVTTALITLIITSLCCKYRYEKVKVDHDKKDTSTHNSGHENEITMQSNPAYGAVSITRMTTNPTYETKVDTIPLLTFKACLGEYMYLHTAANIVE